jgi:hypothetical protein
MQFPRQVGQDCRIPFSRRLRKPTVASPRRKSCRMCLIRPRRYAHRANQPCFAPRNQFFFAISSSDGAQREDDSPAWLSLPNEHSLFCPRRARSPTLQTRFSGSRWLSHDRRPFRLWLGTCLLLAQWAGPALKGSELAKPSLPLAGKRRSRARGKSKFLHKICEGCLGGGSEASFGPRGRMRRVSNSDSARRTLTRKQHATRSNSFVSSRSKYFTFWKI